VTDDQQNNCRNFDSLIPKFTGAEDADLHMGWFSITSAELLAAD
jgi:hypothetical protein